MIRLHWRKKPFQADKIVVGLGNPGAEYTGTRHNLGFRALDAFLGLTGKRKGFKLSRRSRIQTVTFAGVQVLLVKPSTFMNLSGSALGPILQITGRDIGDVLVIHDEMDLDPGQAKMKFGGRDAGHRGIADIIENCGTGFTRVKIGIGKPSKAGEGASIEWVLGKPGSEEEEKFSSLMPMVAEAVSIWITGGHEKAITWFNTAQRQSAKSGKNV